MRAIRILQEEHRALREVLDALELVLDGQRADDRLDGELALDALEWFERFADGLHQDREELGLFPRLMARAPGKTRRILEDLMRWHAHERTRLAEMRARIEGAAYERRGAATRSRSPRARTSRSSVLTRISKTHGSCRWRAACSNRRTTNSSWPSTRGSSGCTCGSASPRRSHARTGSSPPRGGACSRRPRASRRDGLRPRAAFPRTSPSRSARDAARRARRRQDPCRLHTLAADGIE